MSRPCKKRFLELTTVKAETRPLYCSIESPPRVADVPQFGVWYANAKCGERAKVGGGGGSRDTLLPAAARTETARWP